MNDYHYESYYESHYADLAYRYDKGPYIKDVRTEGGRGLVQK